MLENGKLTILKSLVGNWHTVRSRPHTGIDPDRNVVGDKLLQTHNGEIQTISVITSITQVFTKRYIEHFILGDDTIPFNWRDLFPHNIN